MKKIRWINRPPKGRTSMGYLWELWRGGQMEFTDFIKQFVNRWGNSTYPMGEDAYWASVDQHGGMTWYAPHNLWRAVAAHFPQGFFMFVPAGGLCWVFGITHWPGIALVFASAVGIEYRDWIRQKRVFYFKNAADVIDRSLGATLGAFVWHWIF